MTNEKRQLILVSAGSGAIATLIICALVGGIVFLYPTQVANALRLPQAYSTSAQVSANSPTVKPANNGTTDVVGVVKKSRPSVVSITIKQTVPTYDQNNTGSDPFEEFFGMPSPFGNMYRERKQTGTQEVEVGGGTGFLISKDGYIVTNKHVVSSDQATYVVTTDDGKTHDAKVIAKDPSYDIAIIKIEGSDFPYLTFGDSKNIEVGETAIAIGNALAEFKNTVSLGVISGLSRNIVAGDGMGSAEQLDDLIQTDAAINPGNSGGPLLNINGDVIGVNVATANAQNIGFAIPSNVVMKIADSVQKTGKIERPFLGIRYLPITEEMKKRNQLPVNHGVLVARGDQQGDIAVIPGSSADKAGIVENDIVLEIDGVKIDEQHPLQSLVRQKNIGDTMKLKILHKGEEKTVSVKLEAFKD